MTITLYSRAGCHLCEDAREILEEACARLSRMGSSVVLEETDIDGDMRLRTLYTHDVPVVMIDGREAFRHFVHADKLWKILNP